MNITKLSIAARLSYVYKETRNVNTSLASTMRNISVRSHTFRSAICNTDLVEKIGGRNKLLNFCTFKIISKEDRWVIGSMILNGLLAKVLYCLHRTRGYNLPQPPEDHRNAAKWIITWILLSAWRMMHEHFTYIGFHLTFSRITSNAAILPKHELLHRQNSYFQQKRRTFSPLLGESGT